MSLLAIHYYGSHADFVLREQRFACGILKRNAAILARDDDFQLRNAQRDGVFRGLHLPLCYRPTVFYHYEFWTRGKRRRRGIAHANDRIGAHLQLQRSVLQRQSHSVGFALHGENWVQWIPLRAHRARDEQPKEK